VPFFTRFEDAYAWFMGGGALISSADARDELTGGRAQYLAFHAALDAPATAHAMAQLNEFGDVEGLEPSLPEHLHITLLPLGFQVLERRREDDVLRQDVARYAEAAARALKGMRPVEFVLGPVNVFPNALILEVHDADGRVDALRSRLLDATGLSGDSSMPFLPHVTLAMFNDSGVDAPLRGLLPPLRQLPSIRARLQRVELGRWWFTGFDERASIDLDIVRSYVLR